MIQLSSPIEVIPSSWVVPRLMVQNSRIVITVTDDQFRGFISVFLVLRVITNRAELVEAIIFTDRGRAVDDNMTFDPRAHADFDILPDDSIRPTSTSSASCADDETMAVS